MGTSSSRHGDLTSNEYFEKFSKKEHISPNDPFWNRFLSFSFTPPTTSPEHQALDERIETICRLLLTNNLQSGNFGSLLDVFLFRASELIASTQTDNNMFIWQTYNALFILRCITKFFVENLNEDDLVRQFEAHPSSSHDAELWNMLTFGFGRSNNAAAPVTTDGVTVVKPAELLESPLANQSLLLVQVLTNHCTGDKNLHNPYRQALFSCSNSQDPCNEATPTRAAATFKLDLSRLYTTLCHIPSSDQTTLLLYLLVHRNRHVVPILKTLYHAPDSNSHHIYMSLIILLILSEDDLFNKTVHEVDKYLHTNCLAALANMSGQFRSLHPYVSQRLVSLFETLAKKHSRLADQIRQQETGEAVPNSVINVEDPEQTSDLDLGVLEEVLRMVLEIINSCLSHQLAHNPNLVYTLLYKKHVFEPFRNHPAFQDIVQNIDAVILYFSNKLDQVQKDLGVSEVLTTIQHGALQWPKERLKKFPDLKFKYVEEDQPEDFFIPYVWSLVCQSSGLYWNPANIKLFAPDPNSPSVC
ncbi:Dymeclin [Blattella germanica]|nr:Dymeclin [Blattella germanica]